MGTTLTFWDAYIGFGLCVTVFLMMEAGTLWFVSNAVGQRGADWRPLLALLLVCNIAIAVLGVRYFFPATVVGPLVNLVCIGLALPHLRPSLSGTMELWTQSPSPQRKSSTLS